MSRNGLPEACSFPAVMVRISTPARSPEERLDFLDEEPSARVSTIRKPNKQNTSPPKMIPITHAARRSIRTDLPEMGGRLYRNERERQPSRGAAQEDRARQA